MRATLQPATPRNGSSGAGAQARGLILDETKASIKGLLAEFKASVPPPRWRPLALPSLPFPSPTMPCPPLPSLQLSPPPPNPYGLRFCPLGFFPSRPPQNALFFKQQTAPLLGLEPQLVG